MKHFKNAFLIFSILPFIICGCTSNYSTEEVEPTIKYLKLGETIMSGGFYQTAVRLDYKNEFTSDKNSCVIEFEYTINSNNKNIISLGGSYYYKVVFDDNSNNGNLQLVTSPSSLAPNDCETIVLKMRCFTDWKEAIIKFEDNNNNSYAFAIKSSDYPEKSNNIYPRFNGVGDTIQNDKKTLMLTFNGLEKAIIGSAYVDEKYRDNLYLKFSMTNLTSYKINLPTTSMGYDIVSDSGLTFSQISWSTENPPSEVAANSTVQLRFIIIVEKGWEQIVFSIHESYTEAQFIFKIYHSDYSY